jgi:DNA-binding HxlR family transcriptional regulator
VKRLAKRFGCPVELSLELLGGKWKPVILARLKERPHRYSELRKLIPNLSTKMLSQRLRDLEIGCPLPGHRGPQLGRAHPILWTG